MAEARISYRDEIAQEIITRIEAGTAPWQKPWSPNTLGAGPFNPTSGKPYRGINDLWLTMQGHSDPRWMTFKQALAVDAKVRKGSRATTIEYWQWSERTAMKDQDGKPVLDAEGNPRYREASLDRPRVFYAKVFNASQIDDLAPWIAPAPSFDPIERAEAIVASSGVPVFHDQQDRAFYRPMTDEIHLNPRSDFKSAAAYYETVLHELGHATGHESRLDRFFGPHGAEEYAREELRAEIASYMLARDLGIGFDPSNHSAYAKSWLKALQEDKNEIFRAARDSEIIKTWVMEPEQRQALEQAAQNRKQAEQKEHAMSETPAVRVYLTVPYAERAAAKAAGARFDGKAKRWYMPDRANPAALAQWAEQPQSAPANRTQGATVEPKAAPEPPKRIFLAVPYSEKDAAKALGAKYSRNDKSWWVPEGTDLAPFAKWSKGAEAAKPAEVSPQAEFANFLEANGLVLKGAPEMDGKWHRVQTNDDKGKEKRGSYRGFLDGRPAGQAINGWNGKTVKWVATGSALTVEERARIQAEAAQVRANREAERVAAAEKAAKTAFGVWSNLPGNATPENCPYLGRKDVGGHGVKVNKDGNLVVPQRDAGGRLWGVQFCSPEGKRFLKDSLHIGTMHVIEPSGKGTLDAITPAMGGTIVIAEGYATAATIHEATGRPVVVAFDCGNLKAVAEAVRAAHPERELMIAGDNDHSTKINGELVNVGALKAEEAAQAVGGIWTAPKFNDEEKAKGLTDFNDFAQSQGKAAVRRAIETALNRGRGEDLARGIA